MTNEMIPFPENFMFVYVIRMNIIFRCEYGGIINRYENASTKTLTFYLALGVVHALLEALHELCAVASLKHVTV